MTFAVLSVLMMNILNTVKPLLVLRYRCCEEARRAFCYENYTLLKKHCAVVLMLRVINLFLIAL